MERDYNIQVWDMRRPFFPMLQFGGHTLAVTDLIWGPEDVMVSCSKVGSKARKLQSSYHPLTTHSLIRLIRLLYTNSLHALFFPFSAILTHCD